MSERGFKLELGEYVLDFDSDTDGIACLTVVSPDDGNTVRARLDEQALVQIMGFATWELMHRLDQALDEVEYLKQFAPVPEEKLADIVPILRGI